MSILQGIIIFLFGTFLYIILNLFRKLEFLEKNYLTLLEKVELTIVNMREIDNRQMFEKDDEVGEIFRQLTETVEDLSKFIEIEER